MRRGIAEFSKYATHLDPNLRLALVLEHLKRIPGFLAGKHVVQARVDAWHVSVSKPMAEEVEKLKR